MGKLLCAIGLAALLGQVQAQMPLAKPQASTWAELVEFEFRLKGVPSATGTVATVKLIKAKFPTLNATKFGLDEPCWNKTSVCPVVVSATAQVFIKLPWSTRLNVTKYVLCEASECLLPPFAQMQAKPGEGYRFRYNRLTAVWDTPPSVIAIVAAPPPAPTVTASKPGDSIPALMQLVDLQGAVWTFTGGQVTRDKVVIAKPHADDDRLYVGANGLIRISSPSKGYLCWIGSAWSGSGC